jgi:hypothetical protein
MFLRTLLKMLAWSALMWSLLILPTLALWPLERTSQALELSRPDYQGGPSRSIFTDEIQEAMYRIGSHCPMPTRTRLVILGSSGSRGFWPELLQGATSADEVINISVIDSNFTQIRQMYEDLAVCLGPEGLHRATFVLAPSLGSFVSDKLRFKTAYSAYEAAKLRSRLFTGSPGTVEPLMTRRWLPLAIDLWRPVILARYLVERLRIHAQALHDRVHQLISGAAPEPALQFNPEQVLSMITALLPPEGADDSFAAEQHAALEGLIGEIRAGGSTVLLVEPPTQAWARTRSAEIAESHQQIQDVATKLAVPHIDLYTSGGDDEFHDAWHANAKGAPLWSTRLAAALHQLGQSDPKTLGPVAPALNPP